MSFSSTASARLIPLPCRSLSSCSSPSPLQSGWNMSVWVVDFGVQNLDALNLHGQPQLNTACCVLAASPTRSIASIWPTICRFEREVDPLDRVALWGLSEGIGSVYGAGRYFSAAATDVFPGTSPSQPSCRHRNLSAVSSSCRPGTAPRGQGGGASLLGGASAAYIQANRLARVPVWIDQGFCSIGIGFELDTATHDDGLDSTDQQRTKRTKRRKHFVLYY
jgi:hypothetical protein